MCVCVCMAACVRLQYCIACACFNGQGASQPLRNEMAMTACSSRQLSIVDTEGLLMRHSAGVWSNPLQWQPQVPCDIMLKTILLFVLIKHGVKEKKECLDNAFWR